MLNQALSQQNSPGGDLPAFLSRAAKDDRFRSEIRQNPVEAFARFGLQVAPSRVPSAVTLPEKMEIEQVLATSSGDGEAIVKELWGGFFAI